MCKAPSFCLGSAFGLVRTSTQNCIVFGSIFLRFLHAECNSVCAAVIGETKSSKISETDLMSIGPKKKKEKHSLDISINSLWGKKNHFTKFHSDVFVRIGIPEVFVGGRIRKNWEQNEPYNLEHVRFQEIPGIRVTHSAIFHTIIILAYFNRNHRNHRDVTVVIDLA